MKMPKISVIVPVYNAEKYLHRCVDSILSQTFTEFELLLIDDGSTDKSGEICDEYAIKDSRIRVFHKENGGVSSARNLGLDNALGEWVTFMDSDDDITLKWLEEFYNYIKWSEKVLYVQHAHCLNGRIDVLLHENLSSYVDKDVFLFEDGFGYVWNKLFKKDIILKNNIYFDEKLKCYEDEIFVLEYCSYVDSIMMLPVAEYYYYMPDDFSKKYSEKNNFYTLLHHYELTKKIYFKRCKKLVDSLICMALKFMVKNLNESNEIADLCRKKIGQNIKWVEGKRKVPLKLLAYSNNRRLWLISLKIYSYLMMKKLI